MEQPIEEASVACKCGKKKNETALSFCRHCAVRCKCGKKNWSVSSFCTKCGESLKVCVEEEPVCEDSDDADSSKEKDCDRLEEEPVCDDSDDADSSKEKDCDYTHVRTVRKIVMKDCNVMICKHGDGHSSIWSSKQQPWKNWNWSWNNSNWNWQHDDQQWQSNDQHWSKQWDTHQNQHNQGFRRKGEHGNGKSGSARKRRREAAQW